VVRLSVNVNKIATLRNSRGGETPSVVGAAQVCIDAGAPGITVHPRADRRHITPRDVTDIATLLAPLRDRVEYNIEGDPRPDLLDLVHEIRPHQMTLVPVLPGEITSQAGGRHTARCSSRSPRRGRAREPVHGAAGPVAGARARRRPRRALHRALRCRAGRARRANSRASPPLPCCAAAGPDQRGP
jgi:hypothetical protein